MAQSIDLYMWHVTQCVGRNMPQSETTIKNYNPFGSHIQVR